MTHSASAATPEMPEAPSGLMPGSVSERRPRMNASERNARRAVRPATRDARLAADSKGGGCPYRETRRARVGFSVTPVTFSMPSIRLSVV